MSTYAEDPTWNPMLDDDDDEERALVAPSRPRVRVEATDSVIERLPTPRSRRRKWLTERDAELLSFIARFKVSNPDQLAAMSRFTNNRSTVASRLSGLKNAGFVTNFSVLTGRRVWIVTRKGMEWLDAVGGVSAEDCTLVTASDLQYNSHLSHTLAVAHLASQLLAGTSGVPGVTERAPLSALVSEYQIDSEWKSWKAQAASEAYGGEVFAHALVAARKSDRPFWTLVGGRSGVAKAFHNPDLVVVAGCGKALALEVELTMKKTGEYRKILMNYKENFSLPSPFYQKVVWLVTSESTAKRIEGVAQELGISKKVVCVPLLGHDGQPFRRSAYLL